MHDDSVSCKADGGLVSILTACSTTTEMCQSFSQQSFFMHEHHMCTTLCPERIQVQIHAFTNKHPHTHLFANTDRNLVWEHSCHYVKKDAQWGKGRSKNDGDRWEEGGSKWCMRSCDLFNLEYGIMRGKRKEACIWNTYFKSEGEEGSKEGSAD